MAEIDRVNSAIKAFFNSSGAEQVEALAKAIGSCIERANRRSVELNITDEKVLDLAKSAENALQELKKNLPKDKEALISRFSEVAEKAMVARRANYPLKNPDAPWAPPTAQEALRDDDDAYAFAIFDTLSEEIGELLPSLYRLAVEGDWEGNAPGEE